MNYELIEEEYCNQMDDLNIMIANEQVLAGDGIEVVNPNFPIIKHYFTFYETDEFGYNWFFVAHAGIKRVKIQREDEIAELATKYTLTKIVPLRGDEFDRLCAVERGKSMVGKRYSWIGRNCENTMNYIQFGKSFSTQTRTISSLAIMSGIGMAAASKNKSVRTTGTIVGVLGVIALFIDLFGENNP